MTRRFMAYKLAHKHSDHEACVWILQYLICQGSDFLVIPVWWNDFSVWHYLETPENPAMSWPKAYEGSWGDEICSEANVCASMVSYVTMTDSEHNFIVQTVGHDKPSLPTLTKPWSIYFQHKHWVALWVLKKNKSV